MYRIRVFDHGHYIKGATVPNRGQDRINLVVKGKDYFFFGEEVKLAFMINQDIPPKIFGNIMEIDFDVRDATQLADLFDLCPTLVYQINENLFNTLKAMNKDKKNVLDAEFTEKTETQKETQGKSRNILDDPEKIAALTDPVPEEPPKKELSDLEKTAEKIPGVKQIVKTIDAVAYSTHALTANLRGVKLLNQIHWQDDNDEKQLLMKKLLAFCSIPENQKCLRWLPKRLDIEPEIFAVVSQIELDGVGINPMYYIKQSAAEISEKMLQRPRPADDWKTSAIYIIGMLLAFGLVAVFILRLAGKL